MGTYGAAYGIPFAVEGLFFFLEAIFVAIYIYGWKRMRPWPHFWTGVPVVLSGHRRHLLGRGRQRLDEPARRLHHARRAGRRRATRCEVIFNGAFWYEALHMLLAAYMVAGFIVAGVYAVGMLRGRRDRYHRLGLRDPAHRRGDRDPAADLRRRRRRPRGVRTTSRPSSPRSRCCRTGTHVPAVLGGCWSTGEVPLRASRSPRAPRCCPATARRPASAGLDAIPAACARPTTWSPSVHLAFDVMVGIGTRCCCSRPWFAFAWWRRRDLPENRWFLRAHRGQRRRSPSSRSRPAGWSPRSAASRGRSSAYLLTRDAVTTCGQPVAVLRRDARPLRRRRRRHLLRAAAAAPPLASAAARTTTRGRRPVRPVPRAGRRRR